MPGRQLLDVAKGSPRRQGHPEREDLVERFQIQFARNFGTRQQGLDLGGKQKPVAGLRVKQRPHSKPVAGKKKLSPRDIPDREGPLAIEVADALLTLLLVKMQNDFSVRSRAKSMAPPDQL